MLWISLSFAAIGDIDDDGIPDTTDTCPLFTNPDQVDADSDGIGDVCDICPLDADPGQQDRDGDGFGDMCDVCPDIADPDQTGDACAVEPAAGCATTPRPLRAGLGLLLLGMGLVLRSTDRRRADR